MLDKNNGSEISDINEWADGMLTAILENGISFMIVKEG